MAVEVTGTPLDFRCRLDGRGTKTMPDPIDIHALRQVGRIMTESETILKMIETADPADTMKLDEIDARVWCRLSDKRYHGTMPMWKHANTIVCEDGTFEGPYYSRSRDALKAIRPEGFGFDIEVSLIGHRCSATMPDTLNRFVANLPTEELAELHAIIQAIEYERRNAGGCLAPRPHISP
jgi:hypothetical protein